jgi:hypothetical protein
MIFASLDGLAWLVGALIALWFLQRSLHREIQAVTLIVTRSVPFTMGFFSFVFFPGIVLHEMSHYVSAKLLRVRTGRIWLLPNLMANGKLRLGYVEVGRSDIVRDSLVGAAPFISGLITVALIAIYPLHMTVMWDTFRNGQWDLFFLGLQILPTSPYFALWFYLTFVISSTMLPSESDRDSWLPLGLVIVVLLALAIFAGAGPWMMANLAPLINPFLRGVALLMGLSVIVHALLFVPLWMIHTTLTRITGRDVR